MLRTLPWPSWTLYVRSGVASGAKHSPPGVEKWKNQGPTIRLSLAASNRASAQNIEDSAECYYIQVEDTESFQDQGRYVESVENLFATKPFSVRHETSLLTKNGEIFDFSKHRQNDLGSSENCSDS